MLRPIELEITTTKGTDEISSTWMKQFGINVVLLRELRKLASAAHVSKATLQLGIALSKCTGDVVSTWNLDKGSEISCLEGISNVLDALGMRFLSLERCG